MKTWIASDDSFNLTVSGGTGRVGDLVEFEVMNTCPVGLIFIP